MTAVSAHHLPDHRTVARSPCRTYHPPRHRHHPLKGIERFFGGVLNLAACALVMVVLTISMRTCTHPAANAALSDSKTLSWMVASTPRDC